MTIGADDQALTGIGPSGDRSTRSFAAPLLILRWQDLLVLMSGLNSRIILSMQMPLNGIFVREILKLFRKIPAQ